MFKKKIHTTYTEFGNMYVHLTAYLNQEVVNKYLKSVEQ